MRRAPALTGRGTTRQVNGNLHDAAVPSIARAAERARLPLFGFGPGQIRRGAVLVLANDYFDAGPRIGAHCSARYVRGEPGAIPLPGNPAYPPAGEPRRGARGWVAIPKWVLARADQR